MTGPWLAPNKMKFIDGVVTGMRKKTFRKTALNILCASFLSIPSFYRASAEEDHRKEPEIKLTAERQYALTDEEIVVHVSASSADASQTFVIEPEYDHAELGEMRTNDKSAQPEIDDGTGGVSFTLEADSSAEFDLIFRYCEEQALPEETGPAEEETAEPEVTSEELPEVELPEEEITEEPEEEEALSEEVISGNDADETEEEISPAEEETENSTIGAGIPEAAEPLYAVIPVFRETETDDGTEGSTVICYGPQGSEQEEMTLIWITDGALSEQTFIASDDNTEISVTGLLPNGGNLVFHTAEGTEIPGQNILAAGNLSVSFAAGAVYQPREEEPLNVVVTSDALKEYRELTSGADKVNVNIFTFTEEGEAVFLQEAALNDDGSVSFAADHLSSFAVSVKNQGRLRAPVLRAPAGAQEADLDFADEGVFEINMFDYTAYDTDYAELSPYTNKNLWQDRFKTGINVDANGNWRDLLFTPSGVHKGYGEPYSINNYTGGNHSQHDTDRGGPIYYPAALQGIVRDELKNGYPELNYGFDGSSGSACNVPLNSGDARASLEYLFNPNDTSHNGARTDYLGLEHLFYKVDGNDNKLQYDSSNYYAYLKDQSTKEFTVYDPDKKPIGFFPFNDYDASKTSANLEGNFNHQFGMTVKADFTVPEGGKIVTTNPDGSQTEIDEEFTFTGDDDVWVFIDGKLVLDLGGIHKPLKGTINFATGEVTLDHFANIMTSDGSENIYPKVVHVGDTTNQTGPGTNPPKQIQQTNLNDILPGYKDRPYEKHTIQIFYLERGGCDSNLRIEMNMDFTKTIRLEKEVIGDSADEHKNDEFEYRFFLQKINNGQGSGEPSLVTDPDTHLNDPVMTKNDWKIKLYKTDADGNKTLITPDPQTGIFTLKHGETVEVRNIPGDLKYYFEEVNVDTDVFPETKAYTKLPDGSEEELNLTAEDENDKKTYRTDPENIMKRDNVRYINDTGIDLPVVKEWKDEDGNVITRTLSDYEEEFGDEVLTFTLMRKIASEEEYTDTGRTITLPKKDGSQKIWEDVFKNLPRTDPDGNEYEYTVKETPIGGYETTVRSETSSSEPGMIIVKESIGVKWVKAKTFENNKAYAVLSDTNRLLSVRSNDVSYISENQSSDIVTIRQAGQTELKSESGDVYTEYIDTVPARSQWSVLNDGNLSNATAGGRIVRTRNWGNTLRYQPNGWDFSGGNPAPFRWLGNNVKSSIKQDDSSDYLDNEASPRSSGYAFNNWTLYEPVELFREYEVPGPEPEEKTTIIVSNKKIPTIDIPFVKTGTRPEADGKPKVLEGAEFVLEDSSGAAVDTKTSGTDGRFAFEKLSLETTYYLRETKAPDDYVLPSVRWEIRTVSRTQYQIRREGEDDSKWQTVNVGDTSDPYQIKNTEIYNLPSAGGSGTYWHTVLGTAVFMFALLKYLNERKRGRRHERV